MAARTRRHIESQMFTSENETPPNVRNAHASVTNTVVRFTPRLQPASTRPQTESKLPANFFNGNLRENEATRGGQRESAVFLSEFSMFQHPSESNPGVVFLCQGG